MRGRRQFPASVAVTWFGAHQAPPALDPERVDCWFLRIAEPTQDDWDLLSVDEKARADRFIVHPPKRQFVSTRAWLRRTLSAYLSRGRGRDPKSLEFVYGEHGKPALRGEASLAFNVSHSDDFAVLAVTRACALGVDIERCKANRSLVGIARRFFARAEFEAFEGLAQGQQLDLFYRLWARKEAYLKAVATGLSFASNRFTVETAAGSVRVLETALEGDDAASWYLHDIAGPEGYATALCAAASVRQIRVQESSHGCA